jgi:hypothetical protein
MLRRPLRLIALACTAALAAALVAGPSNAAVPRAAQQGVTKTSVDVAVLIADLDGLRALGLNLPASLTTGNLTKRWEVYFKAIGPINGRTINVIPVTWNPADPTSFDKTCIKATQDNKPFAVLNATGYRASSVGCITVDNNTFMFYGDSSYKGLIDASKKNLVTLGLPAEVSAATAASVLIKQKIIPKTAKIGLLGGNEPAIKAAGDTAEAAFKKAGYTIANKTEINVTGQATADQLKDATAAVATMKAAGVTDVIITVPFTVNTGFFNEAQNSGLNFHYNLVDYGGSLCTQFGAASVPAAAAAAGMSCVTVFDTKAIPAKTGTKKDTAFEAKCRAQYDAGYGVKSVAGVPAGGRTDASGTFLVEDFPPNECTMSYLFATALKGAGKNPTASSLYDSFLKITKYPAAYMSDGDGGFGKNKNYFAKFVHLESVVAVATSQTKDATTGLYNGCPAPTSCFVPVLIDGQEWFPVVQG